MAKYDSLQGAIALLVLKILARRGPTHGYGIASHIEAMSNDVLSVEEGSLYPALYRMERRAWIDAEWGTSELGRRAKFYRLTPDGKKQLKRETDAWATFAAGVSKVLLAR